MHPRKLGLRRVEELIAATTALTVALALTKSVIAAVEIVVAPTEEINATELKWETEAILGVALLLEAGTETFGGVNSGDGGSVALAATVTVTAAVAMVAAPTAAMPATKLKWEREIAAILLEAGTETCGGVNSGDDSVDGGFGGNGDSNGNGGNGGGTNGISAGKMN